MILRKITVRGGQMRWVMVLAMLLAFGCAEDASEEATEATSDEVSEEATEATSDEVSEEASEAPTP